MNHVVGTYSRTYALLLAALITLAAVVSLVTAIISKKRSSISPALNIFLLIVGISVTAITIEFILRFTVYNDVFARYRETGQEKLGIFGFASEKSHEWYFKGARYTTDSYRYRTNLKVPMWSESTRNKIFVVGGSSAFGYGLNDDETWQHLLQGGADTPIVINAGNNGYNSFQSVLRYYLEIATLDPCAVIFYQSRNDARPYKASPDMTLMGDDILFSNTMTQYLAKKHPSDSLYERTVIGNMLKAYLGGRVLKIKKSVNSKEELNTEDRDLNETANHNTALYKRNIETLIDMTTRDKIALYVVTFLWNPEGIHPKKSFFLERNNAMLRRIAQERGIELIDIAKAFTAVENKKEYFLGDGYHPSKVGAGFIARKINEYFEGDLNKACFSR